MTLEALMTSLKPLKSKGSARPYENHNLEIGALGFETEYCTEVHAACVGTDPGDNFICVMMVYIYIYLLYVGSHFQLGLHVYVEGYLYDSCVLYIYVLL